MSLPSRETHLRPGRTIPYSGALTIGCCSKDIESFTANVDNLVFGLDVVRFKVSGFDDVLNGKFFIEGTAPYIPAENKFSNANLIVHYSLIEDKVPTRLTFEARELNDGHAHKCYISGEWHDESGTWSFHGLLSEHDLQRGKAVNA